MKTYDEARAGAAQRPRQLRRASSDAEKRLWRAVRSRLPRYELRRQMPVGPCFADLASPAAKLIIELDGGQQGYPVLCFWNNDAPSNPNRVLERIDRPLSQGRGQLETPQ